VSTRKDLPLGRIERLLRGINKGMEGYLRKIQQLPRNVNKLSVWDIDDTLFKSKDIRIYVIKDNQIVKKLSTSEFNKYNKRLGEEFDFSEFRDGAIFFHSAKPLRRNLELAKKALESKDTMMMTLSARAKTNRKDLFLKKFEMYGIDMDMSNSHSVFAGDKALPTAKAKADVIDKCLSTGKFNSVHMYDDHRNNLVEFLKLEKKYPKVSFNGFLVNIKSGKISEF
jgi:hypothetical protein